MVYKTTDSIYVLPFLHDRKIAYSQLNENDEYFNFIFENSLILINFTESFFDIYSHNGVRINRVNFEQIGKPIAVSPSGINYLYLRKSAENMTLSIKKFTP